MVLRAAGFEAETQAVLPPEREPGASRAPRRSRSGRSRWCRSGQRRRAGPASRRAGRRGRPLRGSTRLRGAAPGSRVPGSPPASGRSPRAPGPAISWFQSSTPCSTVIVGKVAGSTWWGTRPSTSSDPSPMTPCAEVPGGDDADPEEHHRRRRSQPTRTAGRRTEVPGSTADRDAVGEPADGVVRSLPARARAGRGADGPAHITTSPPSKATFVPNSSVCGAIMSVHATATRKPNRTRPTRPDGTVFGSVIMKNRKISSSGENMITRQ